MKRYFVTAHFDPNNGGWYEYQSESYGDCMRYANQLIQQGMDVVTVEEVNSTRLYLRYFKEMMEE